MNGPVSHRWAWAEIDLAAVAHNVGVMRSFAAPADVWAVVKADAYGHGAIPISNAALDAGCVGLCVALAQEGVELREAGISAPILVLTEQSPADLPILVAHGLTPTVSSSEGIDALAALRVRGLPVHLKLDTGMHRVGAHPDDAKALAARIGGHHPWIELEGVYTHLAVADELENPYTDQQLARFDEALTALPDVALVHAANSAGAMAHPAARRSFVRAGIALYGVSPGPGVDLLATDLRPVMAVKARVSFVKRLAAGDRLSYGLCYTMPAESTVATVPIGYADGVRRNLTNIGEVLLGGRRRRIIGAVTMDQLMVDCGDDPVQRGDEVVLLGRQGDERITAEEWARHLGTIGYEITCGVSPRVPRVLR